MCWSLHFFTVKSIADIMFVSLHRVLYLLSFVSCCISKKYIFLSRQMFPIDLLYHVYPTYSRMQAGLGISSFAHSLKSLRTNEQMWAICSGRSGQMSECEQFAQVAQDKWATVSESLRSLRTNEQLWANRSGHSWLMSECKRFAQVAQHKMQA